MKITNKFLSIIYFLTLAAFLLGACGSFAIEGQAQSDGGSGITITGDTEVLPDQANESNQSGAPILGENATQILLILSGFAIFILILLVLVGRTSGHTHT